MDDNTFDRLTRTITAAGSRRAVVSTLAGGTLAAFAASAADAKKKRKRKKTSKTTTTTVAPPAPTCSDGIRNGDETGVDCGGSCPPCAVGQPCAKRADCKTALCKNGVCASCVRFSQDCGSNFGGIACECAVLPDNAGNMCVQPAGLANTCFECPPGTVSCVQVGQPRCNKVCMGG
ncbi:MAG: hypothetical protein QM692_10310 [Thermomicrobiales bacterium]